MRRYGCFAAERHAPKMAGPHATPAGSSANEESEIERVPTPTAPRRRKRAREDPHPQHRAEAGRPSRASPRYACTGGRGRGERKQTGESWATGNA